MYLPPKPWSGKEPAEAPSRDDEVLTVEGCRFSCTLRSVEGTMETLRQRMEPDNDASARCFQGPCEYHAMIHVKSPLIFTDGLAEWARCHMPVSLTVGTYEYYGRLTNARRVDGGMNCTVDKIRGMSRHDNPT